jgi:hypothetical protein
LAPILSSCATFDGDSATRRWGVTALRGEIYWRRNGRVLKSMTVLFEASWAQLWMIYDAVFVQSVPIVGETTKILSDRFFIKNQ